METLMEVTDPRVIDDELWEELIKFTHGAAVSCYQCGVCTASCPWGVVREKTDTVRSFVRQAQLGLFDEAESLWLCTACGQCEAYCPRGVPVAEVIRGLRYLMWKRRKTLEGLPSLLWSVYWNNNPWFQPPSLRAQWAKDLELPTFDASSHEVLFYVGCTSSYDRRAQKVARALASILSSSGVSFGVLGEEEPCCGEAVLSVGHRPYFEEIAESTARVFQEKGVESLVTVSPHCYDVFQNQYPHLEPYLQPFHYTQYLAGLLQEKRITFEHSLDRTVTFQDPCFLGRRNQAYDAPRDILKAIPGVTLVEMAHHGVDALCCGGGGGRMWMETPVGERFSDIRVQEALETNASAIVTACPFCIACLEDSLKALHIKDLEVLDVAEFAAQALLGEG
jgi:Fe-S oxidoreductase